MPSLKIKPLSNYNQIQSTHILVEQVPNKVNAIKNLYLEESFQAVKDNLTHFVKQLVENQDHQLNTDEAAKRALSRKLMTTRPLFFLVCHSSIAIME